MLDFIVEKQNSWDYLKTCNLPVFIYGMGDGALKIMSVMKKYKIPISGFFASDEFVRGHYFEQHKVHSLTEIEAILDEFVIVLAFAAGYPSLYQKINEISKKHILIAPDVPVSGDGLFAYEYCIEHEKEISDVYSMLEDSISKKTFSDIINFKISGKISYLNSCTTPKSDVFENIINLSAIENYVDLGAYNGDTVLEFIELTGGKYQKITALEPDKKNFRKLLKATDGYNNIEAINAAAWDSDTVIAFSSKAGRQSAVSENGTEIPARSVDSILDGKSCTIIKMDVEGAEKQAILGAKETISKYSPRLMISLYHRNEDIFELPLLIKKLNTKYKLYLRHQLYIPAWETNLYCTL